MTASRIGGWLLVVLAIGGLVLAVPLVTAHGDGPMVGDAHPTDASDDDWATWMNTHMNEHMGPGAAAQMESHMGMTVDEMARDMADGDHRHATGGGGHC